APGSYEGTIEVATTSRRRCRILLPVKFRIPSEITIMPEIINFGILSRGVASVEAQLITAAQPSRKHVDIILTDSPAALVAHQISGGSDFRVVSVQLSIRDDTGTLSGEMKLHAKWKGGEEEICIPYFALVTH